VRITFLKTITWCTGKTKKLNNTSKHFSANNKNGMFKPKMRQNIFQIKVMVRTATANCC
jgi:hypothetical protein